MPQTRSRRPPAPQPAPPTCLADLRPDPVNRRSHNPRNLAMVTESLQAVGTARSIVIDEDNLILAGNGVTEAAVAAGLTKVQIVDVEGDTVVAVRRRGLTADQKRALAIYDNRTAELAEWNIEQLAADLTNGEDLSAFFLPDELSGLMGTGAAKPGLTDPDVVPEARPTTIQRGDLFELGAHRLLCGDSTQAECYDRLLDGVAVDLCMTDPPYGIGEGYESHDDSKQNLAVLVAAFFPLARARSRVVLLTPGNDNQRYYPPPDWTLCWFVSAGTGRSRWGFSCWQPVLAYGKDPYLADGRGARPDALGKTESADNALGHPCPKPVGVWSWFLERGTVNKGTNGARSLLRERHHDHRL